MGGDYSKWRFNPRDNFKGVLMQQGRVQLDADWNEQVVLANRRQQAQILDIMGQCAVPQETPNAFKVSISSDGTNLNIGRGRIYIDGMDVENHGEGTKRFDARLAEECGTDDFAMDIEPLDDGMYLIYLDAWQRELTCVEVSDLIDSALGVDTTTRLQTMWQVRILKGFEFNLPASEEITRPPLSDIPTRSETTPGVSSVVRRTTTSSPTTISVSIPATISSSAYTINTGSGLAVVPTATSILQLLSNETKPSDGRLTTGLSQSIPTLGPCDIPVQPGYTGLENQLYRLEIHDGGKLGEATFKWARDNASAVAAVSKLTGPSELQLSMIGRDKTMNFKPSDWIEITDDYYEREGQPGVIRRIDKIDGSKITLTDPIDIGIFPVVDDDGNLNEELHTRIRRWDQRGKIRDSEGSLFVDLDADNSSGCIPVPEGTKHLILENGIEVTFSVATENGKFKSGDYWLFYAREAAREIEELNQAPPRGVHHHYAPLALISSKNGDLTFLEDYRKVFPALSDSGIQVKSVVTASDAYQLNNSVSIPANVLADGLRIVFNQSLDRTTVTNAACAVSVEEPVRTIPLVTTDELPSSEEGEVVGFRELRLDANVKADSNNAILWKPTEQAATHLTQLGMSLGAAFFDDWTIYDIDAIRPNWKYRGTIVEVGGIPDMSQDCFWKVGSASILKRQQLPDNVSKITVNAELSEGTGTTGIVFNWSSQDDFWVFLFQHCWERISYSGAIERLALGIMHVSNGTSTMVHQRVVADGKPTNVVLSVEQGPSGLLFKGGVQLVNATTPINVEFSVDQVPPTFIAGSSLGLTCYYSGDVRIKKLQILHDNNQQLPLIPISGDDALLARLTIRRNFLRAQPFGLASIPSLSLQLKIAQHPDAKADFELWFWITRVSPSFTPYRYIYISGAWRSISGIGAHLI